MNIGLIFPNKDRKDKTIHLGLAYIAAYARERHGNLNISVLDTRVATKNEFRSFFKKSFDLIGLTVLSPVYFEVIDVFKKLKKIYPETPICLGGPYVTTIMEEIFEDTPADYAVYGEGEVTFSELIDSFIGSKRIQDINGLMYILEGKIITNPPREQIKNLDSLPIPAYDLFKMKRYPMHRITTTRGCPYTCVFCNSSSIWLGKWRKRSPEKIVSEMEYLVKHYGKKPFFFNDNSFNIDVRRVESICDLILSRKLDVLWTTPVRVELVTAKLAKLMKESGCYNVSIGIESANKEVLARMKKNNSIENVRKGINIFKEAGIEVLGQFVIGSIGDTLETVKETIEFAKKSNLDFIMFYSILPYKGTEQWDYIEKKGKLYGSKIHKYHEVSPRIVFETPEFSYSERLCAIEMAKGEGFYSETNNRSLVFDLGKIVATRVQQILPTSISTKLYLNMKNVYRSRIRKR